MGRKRKHTGVTYRQIKGTYIIEDRPHSNIVIVSKVWEIAVTRAEKIFNVILRKGLLKPIALLFLTIAVSGCTFLPVPVAYLNYARNGYDVTQIAEGGLTTTDRALSVLVNMDCQFFNVLDGEDVCVKRTQKWEP